MSVCKICCAPAMWHIVTQRDSRKEMGEGWTLSVTSGYFYGDVCDEHLLSVLKAHKESDYNLVYHLDSRLPDSFDLACVLEAAFREAASYYPESFDVK